MSSAIDFNKSWCACPSCGCYDDGVPAVCCFDCFFYLGSAESAESTCLAYSTENDSEDDNLESSIYLEYLSQ